MEVQGGHIVRSTGRKDRHSKVCTAKGPRDRRVRLSAHTAIQFYDVQDRLGYDRPSKAVDWLIKKAKSAIDELEQLPAWDPTSSAWASLNQNPSKRGSMAGSSSLMDEPHMLEMGGNGNNASGNSHSNQTHNDSNSSFLPPSMDSDSIADTIKSFFPMGGSTAAAAVVVGSNTSPFHNSFTPPPQDLRLSLQSFDDHPILLHPQHHAPPAPAQQGQQNQADFFNTGIGFDVSWSEHQRMVAWNSSGDGGGGGGGFVFNAPPLLQPLLFGQNNQSNNNNNNHQFGSLSSQRGPLQSSNTPSIRAWIDPSLDHHHYQYYHQNLPIYPSSFGGGGFTGFHIPARIQGEQEEHDGISDKPSSASSDSTRH